MTAFPWWEELGGFKGKYFGKIFTSFVEVKEEKPWSINLQGLIQSARKDFSNVFVGDRQWRENWFAEKWEEGIRDID